VADAGGDGGWVVQGPFPSPSGPLAAPRPSPRAGQPGKRSKGGSTQLRRAASAARKIQKAYRRFRGQFPAGGALHSRSSPSPVIYQDDARLSSELSRLLQRALVRLARMSPEARDDEIAGALAAGRVRAAPGMVRAALTPSTGRAAFTGGSAARWAVRGYHDAREALPAVADLTGAQLNYALLSVQGSEAPRLAAALAGTARVRLLRPQASRKSLSPRHGAAVREAVLWAEPLPEAVVGAPGDSFAPARDLRAFLAHALGDFSRYRWRMNPRRRRRVAMPAGFRAKRWIMHSNAGVGAKTLYAWLREMYAWRDRMAPRRNWRALYPRPLLLGGAARRALGAALRDLLRRHLFGLGGARASSGASAGSPESLSPYARALRRARLEAKRAGGRGAGAGRGVGRRAGSAATGPWQGEGGSRAPLPPSPPARRPSLPPSPSARRPSLSPLSSAGSFLGVSRTRPRRRPASNLRVAGIFGDDRHAGAFVLFARRSSAGWVLQMALLDPLGTVTFPLELQTVLERELRGAVRALRLDGRGGSDLEQIGGVPVVDVQVAFLPVPRRLAVQYASEGSCGPSALALLLSLLRVAKTLPASASPADAAAAAFRSVRDEDVVLAVQLHHNGVL
jgi:hypothetical protein